MSSSSRNSVQKNASWFAIPFKFSKVGGKWKVGGSRSDGEWVPKFQEGDDENRGEGNCEGEGITFALVLLLSVLSGPEKKKWKLINNCFAFSHLFAFYLLPSKEENVAVAREKFVGRNFALLLFLLGSMFFFQELVAF